MSTLVLRIKTKSGHKIVSELLSTDTLNDLKITLTQLTGIPTDTLRILTGFPPKGLELSDCSLNLKEVGITSGDTLIVEENPNFDNITNDEVQLRISERESLSTPGVLMKKVVPGDNSCLFTSVGYVISGKIDSHCANFMRELIANTVAAEPDEYSAAFLNKPNKDYCEWILKPDSWGGAIELSILSKFYGLEIAVVNSVSGNVNRFGEDQHYTQRVFLIFDGIHYDPLYMETFDGGPIQTLFATNNNKILLEAIRLAKEANSSHQFTNIQNITLKCMECCIYLNGSLAASQHAKEFGHLNFGEMAS